MCHLICNGMTSVRETFIATLAPTVTQFIPHCTKRIVYNDCIP